MLAFFSTLLQLLLLAEMLQCIIICWLQSFAQFLLLPSQLSSPRQFELIVWRISQDWNIQKHLTEIKTEWVWFWSHTVWCRQSCKGLMGFHSCSSPQGRERPSSTRLCATGLAFYQQNISLMDAICFLKIFLCPLRIFCTFFTNTNFPPFLPQILFSCPLFILLACSNEACTED